VLRRGCEPRRDAELARCPAGPRPPTRRPPLVPRDIRHDGEEPGPERRARPKTMQEAVRAHERLLGRVVGHAGATDRGGGAPRIALVAAHELGVGVDVSLLRPIDQVRVVQLRIVRGPPPGSPPSRAPRRCTYTGSGP